MLALLGSELARHHPKLILNECFNLTIELHARDLLGANLGEHFPTLLAGILIQPHSFSEFMFQGRKLAEGLQRILHLATGLGSQFLLPSQALGTIESRQSQLVFISRLIEGADAIPDCRGLGLLLSACEILLPSSGRGPAETLLLHLERQLLQLLRRKTSILPRCLRRGLGTSPSQIEVPSH